MNRLLAVAALSLTAATGTASGQEADRPNILVIWGDDIGWANLSAYNHAVMGYSTPNIDRIAEEGILFTDHYAQPSCTAGRAAFITGQYPIRSGMTTVGQPGSPLGLQAESPTLAEVLKAEGYRTGQFGKNHLGDRNEHLPTVHGFDEFFGNLYHLNTQEEAEQRDYQRFAEAYAGSLEAYEEQFGTRGVLHSFATEEFDDTVSERFGVVGSQTIEDTGPLTQERMKTFDTEEMIPKALDFMAASQEAGEPFFVWLNTSRMHLYTRLRDESRYLAEEHTSEYDFYGSGLMEHDMDIGTVLDWLDDQGLSENTIVWYSTDNGPEHSSWPHGGTTPFRGEKMTTYEGGIRVPSVIRWPGVLPEGVTLNGIQAHEDMFTTLAVAAGVEDPVTLVREEMDQYIDGVNNLPYWLGEQEQSARNHIFHYYESQIMAVRIGPWKLHFSTKEDYYAPIQPQTVPVFYNLRADPYESYDDLSAKAHLVQKVSWLFQPMGVLMAEHLQSLAEYPPVQGGASFDMSNVVEDFISKGMQ